MLNKYKKNIIKDPKSNRSYNFPQFLALMTSVVLLLVVTTIVLFYFSTRKDSPITEAKRITEFCSKESDPSHCYEREVPKLLDNHSVAQTFDVIRAIRKEDERYQFCHVLAHLIGERKVSEDPSRWIEVLSENPTDSLCSNGYLHGVIGGKFRADVLEEQEIEKLIPDFSRACEARKGWTPTEFQRAVCYHGMGHLYVFITDANLPLALSICDRTTPLERRTVCIEGVFMQIQQAIEPDDFQLIARMPIKLTQDNIRSFCATFKNEEYVGACLRESWPLFYKEIKDGTGVERFCSGQPNNREQTRCYETIAAILGRTSLNNLEKLTIACNNFPSSYQALCFSAGAQAALEENIADASKAIAVCQKASLDIANKCLRTLVERSKFTLGGGSPALLNFCKKLPPEHQKLCGQ